MTQVLFPAASSRTASTAFQPPPNSLFVIPPNLSTLPPDTVSAACGGRTPHGSVLAFDCCITHHPKFNGFSQFLLPFLQLWGLTTRLLGFKVTRLWECCWLWAGCLEDLTWTRTDGWKSVLAAGWEPSWELAQGLHSPPSGLLHMAAYVSSQHGRRIPRKQSPTCKDLPGFHLHCPC